MIISITFYKKKKDEGKETENIDDNVKNHRYRRGCYHHVTLITKKALLSQQAFAHTQANTSTNMWNTHTERKTKGDEGETVMGKTGLHVMSAFLHVNIPHRGEGCKEVISVDIHPSREATFQVSTECLLLSDVE